MYLPASSTQNFRASYLFLTVWWQNKGKSDDITFWTQLLAFLIVVRPNSKYPVNMCHMILIRHFHSVTLLELSLTMNFTFSIMSILPLLSCVSRSILAKLESTAVISPVSESIRRKGMIMTTDLTLSYLWAFKRS